MSDPNSLLSLGSLLFFADLDLASRIPTFDFAVTIMAPNACFESLLYKEKDDVQEAVLICDESASHPSSSSTAFSLKQKVSIDDLPHLREVYNLQNAIQRIHVLDSELRNQSFLEQYQAELYQVPSETLRRLEEKAPSRLAAQVADFNGNLFYEMKTPRQLEGLGLDELVSMRIGAKDFLGSYLTTESTVPQPAHVDYAWEVLQEHPQLYLGFFPLTDDGMYLQVWPQGREDSDQIVLGEVLFIPYGRLLVVPATTIHAGGFRTTPLASGGEHGNLRFHLYIARKDDCLPQHQTNKYTERHDKRRELCERYVDAPGMDVLQKHLFV